MIHNVGMDEALILTLSEKGAKSIHKNKATPILGGGVPLEVAVGKE